MSRTAHAQTKKTKLILSQEHERILREQVIDGNQPGPILRNFQMLLDSVGPKGVKAGGKYNLLPIDVIGELDRRLSRPLNLELKRPQLRSHPYLQGLHLLFRATGLGRVDAVGSKARLLVDPAASRRSRSCRRARRLRRCGTARRHRGPGRARWPGRPQARPARRR